MTSTLFLRIASVLTLIHCVLHTIGGVLSKPRNGAPEIAVIDAMKSHTFNVMGSMRTYWDFFFGYGLGVTLNLLIQGILFWMLAGLVKNSPAAVRPIVALFGINYLLLAVISFKYFFIAPVITEVLIAASLAAAYFTAASAQRVA
jgi:hypothetical protein